MTGGGRWNAGIIAAGAGQRLRAGSGEGTLKPLVTIDTALARLIAPLERISGVTLLVNGVVQTFHSNNGFGNGNGNTNCQ